MRLRLIALVAAGTLAASGGWAAARQKAGDESKPDYAKAKQHYLRATQALDQGDFAIAAREFGLAYQITKDPILFFKIALSHDKAGDCESALIYYGRYLKEANPTGSDKTDAEARVAGCEQKLGGGDTGTGTGTGTGDSGTGTGDTGTGGGDILAPDVGDLPDGPEDGDGQPTFLDEGTSWQRTAAWVSVGFAVASATTGAVLGLSASSREEDIDTLVNFRDPVNGQPRQYQGEVKRQYDDFVSEGEDLETYSTIAFAAAGVGTIAAVVFFIWDPGPPGAAGEVSSRPKVTPVVSDDTVGVTAGWRF